MSKTEKLGFWSIVLLTINSIIGTGIFLSPGSVVKQVGTYAPLAYLCAAGFAVVLALSFASASRYVVKRSGLCVCGSRFWGKCGTLCRHYTICVCEHCMGRNGYRCGENGFADYGTRYIPL